MTSFFRSPVLTYRPFSTSWKRGAWRLGWTSSRAWRISRGPSRIMSFSWGNFTPWTNFRRGKNHA